MENKKKIIIISSVLLAGAILGVYFYFYKPQGVNVDDQRILVEDESKSKEIDSIIKGIGGTGKFKIEQVPVEEVSNDSIDTIPSVSIPDLNSPVEFTIEYPDDFKKNISDEIERLRWELKKDSYNFSNWISLGLQMKTAGDYDKAKSAWEYASLIRPKNTLSFNNLGDLYHYYLKEYVKAEENLLTSLKNDPNVVRVYLNLHDLYRYSYKQETTSATDILLQGLKMYPDNTDLIIPLAIFYKEKGDKENAEKYYNLAIQSAESKNNIKLVDLLKQDLQNL